MFTGPINTNKYLGQEMMNIYKKVSHNLDKNAEIDEVVLELFEESFIIQLITRFHLEVFLRSFLPLIINCIIFQRIAGNY